MHTRRLKRRPVNQFRGRGVTAAQQTFNLAGEGSIPSGPNSTGVPARSSTVRAGSL